jgi:hypothetical protein
MANDVRDTTCRAASALGLRTVLISDAHSTMDNERLSAPDIIAEFGFHPGNNQLFYAGLSELMRKVSLLKTGRVLYTGADDSPFSAQSPLTQLLPEMGVNGERDIVFIRIRFSSRQ